MSQKIAAFLLRPLLLLTLLSAMMLLSPLSAGAHTQASTANKHLQLLYGHASTRTYHPAAVHHTLKAQPHYLWAKGHKSTQHPNDTNGNLDYNGGMVMEQTTQVYAIFWEPDGSYVSPNYHNLLIRYFQDVGGSPLYANNRQYSDTNNQTPTNAMLAGAARDTQAYPDGGSGTIHDSDIQNEVQYVQSALNWAPSPQTLFAVYLASGEYLCDNSGQCNVPGGFCAYHDAFGDPSNPSIYAALPYDGMSLQGCYGLTTSPNNDPDSDAEISTTSHEQMEAATDPVPPSGWYDNVNQGEIGDKCAYQYGQIDQTGANVAWNGNPYIVQEEWDNNQTGCVLQGP